MSLRNSARFTAMQCGGLRKLVKTQYCPAAPVASRPVTHRRLQSRIFAAVLGDMGDVQQHLIKLQQDLLDSIANRDWQTYSELCDETLTAFEPEAVGTLVQGLPFHRFYFDLLSARENYKPPNNTITQPHVRMLGDSAAVVSCIRLQQKIDSATGRPLTIASEETRVWEKQGGKWRNVHFHRSPTTPSS